MIKDVIIQDLEFYRMLKSGMKSDIKVCAGEQELWR
jgi:hypothetical protein